MFFELLSDELINFNCSRLDIMQISDEDITEK